MTTRWRPGDIVELDGRRLQLLSYRALVDRWLARDDESTIELTDLQMHGLRLVEGVRYMRSNAS